MRDSIVWTVLFVAVAGLLRSTSVATQATPCEAVEAWEAYGGSYAGGYNSTGNLTDIGYNRTAGGSSGKGGMNHTTSHNATIPMPNGTAVPRPTKTPQSSIGGSAFTAKTTAATLVVAILLLAA